MAVLLAVPIPILEGANNEPIPLQIQETDGGDPKKLVAA